MFNSQFSSESSNRMFASDENWELNIDQISTFEKWE
jgi:hypothetical protein